MTSFRKSWVVILLPVMSAAAHGPPAWAAMQTFVDMPLEDFFLDRSELLGKQVRLRANFRTAGDVVFIVLGDGKAATFASVKRAPRDQRKALLDRCSTGCSGVMIGKVVHLMGDIGVDADSIEIDP